MAIGEESTMPIYEYRCEDCGHEMDALQKVSDAPLVNCPACGRASLKKLISAAGFRLKGGGWYETDFKQGGQKRNLHEGGGKAETKSGEGGKGEGKAKPAADTAAKPATPKAEAS
jgi:putative FmdB family regulatory protein